MILNQEEYIEHFGVRGMKWGVRKAPSKVKTNPTDSKVTKDVKRDYNNKSDKEFKQKYATSKKTYAKRVDKYGDPYKNSPAAQRGKKLQDSKFGKRVEKNVAKRDKITKNKISSGLDTGSNVANALLYSPVGAVVIAKRSTLGGREKSNKEKTKADNKISSGLDTGSNVANALLFSPVGAVVIAKRSNREGRN